MRYVMEHEDLIFYFDCESDIEATIHALRIVQQYNLDAEKCTIAMFRKLNLKQEEV